MEQSQNSLSKRTIWIVGVILLIVTSILLLMLVVKDSDEIENAESVDSVTVVEPESFEETGEERGVFKNIDPDSKIELIDESSNPTDIIGFGSENPEPLRLSGLIKLYFQVSDASYGTFTINDSEGNEFVVLEAGPSENGAGAISLSRDIEKLFTDEGAYTFEVDTDGANWSLTLTPSN